MSVDLWCGSVRVYGLLVVGVGLWLLVVGRCGSWVCGVGLSMSMWVRGWVTEIKLLAADVDGGG